jgi:GNAT superfamily N-acetyltransferase
MPQPEIELRPLGSVPTAHVVGLLRVCLGEGARRSEGFWSWKHLENPFGQSPGVAAYSGETLAGIRVFLRWAWSTDSKVLRAVRAVDTATHPDWRRQGLFRRLTEAVLGEVEQEGVDFVFNTPNAQSREGYLKMGWRAVGKVSVLVRVAGPRTWLQRRRDGDHGTSAFGSESSVAALLEDPGLERFLARVEHGERRLHTERTVELLRWRYQPPAAALAYRALWRLDASGSGAVVIARSNDRRGFRELLLSEVLVSGDSPGLAAAAKLLRHLRTLHEHDYWVAHAARGTGERQALLRGGFVVVPRGGPHLTVRMLGRGTPAPDPGAMSSWRLGLGDLEVF